MRKLLRKQAEWSILILRYDISWFPSRDLDCVRKVLDRNSINITCSSANLPSFRFWNSLFSSSFQLHSPLNCERLIMFGALNRFISRLDSDGQLPGSRDGYNVFGFQVLRNKNAEIPIEPWYDFIIGINGRPIVYKVSKKGDLQANKLQDTSDSNLFATEIRNCAGSSVSLAVFSAKVLCYANIPSLAC